MCADQTPTTNDGIPRLVDDYQPRVQLRKYFDEQRISLDDNAIKEICSCRGFGNEVPTTFAVPSDEEIKRSNERSKNKEEESIEKYEDYDRKATQESGMIKKLKVAVLDLLLKKHNLPKR